MAADLNDVSLTGRLTRDVEVREAGEFKVLNMRLASSVRAKLEDGTWGDKSNYFNVVRFTKTDGVVQYLTKGRQVAVSGSLQQREYVDRDGNKRESVEVIADNLMLLAAPKGQEDAQDDALMRDGGEIPF